MSTETALATNMSELATNMSELATNMSELATNMSELATNMSELATNMSELATNMSELATNMSELATNMSELATNMSELASYKIASLVNIFYFNLLSAIEIGQWEGFSTHQIRGTLSFLTPTTLRIEGFNFDGGGVSKCSKLVMISLYRD